MSLGCFEGQIGSAFFLRVLLLFCHSARGTGVQVVMLVLVLVLVAKKAWLVVRTDLSSPGVKAET